MQGIRRTVFFSPNFITDCLETELDLQLEARDLSLTAGGEGFIYVLCLSAHPDNRVFVASLVKRA